MVMGENSLEELDTEANTDKYGHSLLERSAINWMMECDQSW